MNARLLWTLAFACALHVGALHAATQAEKPMNVLTDRLEQSLRKFDSAPADEHLTSLADEVYAFQSRQESPSEVRSFKAHSLVQILAAIEGKIDSTFDPNDPPLRNISPPAQAYPSGVAPGSIRDENQRKEYEAAISANKAKAAVFEQQTALARDRDRVIALLEALASDRTANPSQALAEFTTLLDQYKVGSGSRSRILKAVPRVGSSLTCSRKWRYVTRSSTSISPTAIASSISLQRVSIVRSGSVFFRATWLSDWPEVP